MELRYLNIFNYRKAILVVGVFGMLLFGSQVQAQQDSQYTQYMYNTQTINPAYAGSRGVLRITALYRNQWVGIEGAPETLNFSLSTPLGRNKRVGVGFNVYKDKIGPADESFISADFSYTIPINDDIKLGFGIKGGINLLNVDYSLLNIYNPDDELQQFNIEDKFSPVAGAGIYLHNDLSWYLGLSVPNFLETTHFDDSSISNASEKAVVYAIAGYVFDISYYTKLKPAILGKFQKGAPASIDLSANFLFYDKFNLGLAYRLDAAVSGLIGFQVSNKFYIGYAYDFGTHELGNYHNGSHEMFLRMEFYNIRQRYVTPRFF